MDYFLLRTTCDTGTAAPENDSATLMSCQKHPEPTGQPARSAPFPKEQNRQLVLQSRRLQCGSNVHLTTAECDKFIRISWTISVFSQLKN